ncbi:MAG: hypothetical protein HZC55_03385 [Verrucomicrobia bacterium]|nr:hypothetical protein [Verrucomicrobiota bacterium]
MRRPVASFALCLAWLCANGALLEVAQALVWAKMFSGYAGSMSVAAALERTFDPGKRCHLCLKVAAARKSAQEQLPQAVERSAEKLLLAVHRTAPVILNQPVADWPVDVMPFAPSRRESVPVPPPRV